MSFTRFLSVAALLLVGIGSASAQSVTLQFHDGRVNLVAQNASIRTILAEWARLGGTTVVNGERVGGAPLTIELTDVSERQALDVVLRGVNGYIAAARPVGSTGASSIDRILIVMSSGPTPPPMTTVVQQPPQGFPRQPASVFQGGGIQQGGFPQVAIDPDDPEENPPNDITPDDERRPPNPRVRVPRDFVPPQVNVNGRPVPPQPFQPEPEDQEPPQPAPTPAANNPFGVPPGSARPGVITPVPQPQNRPSPRSDPEP